jgi:FAD/FMN-containing dehydrogenase
LQYQCVLPPETARAGLVQLLERLSSSRRASFLAVLKAFGAEGEGLLSFPRPGYTLALDLPNTGADLNDFLHGLDEVVVRHGGRVYLAKDACLRRESFEAMYPRLAEFKAVKARLDPNGLFASSQARRLGLTPKDGGA